MKQLDHLATYRALGGKGAPIGGGAETDEERAAREAQEASDRAAAEAEAARVAEEEREAAEREAQLPEGARTALQAARQAERQARNAEREAIRLRDAAVAERDRLAADARAREAAELTEQERAQRERDEAITRAEAAEERVRTVALRAEVMAVGAALNLHDPEVAFRLIDTGQVVRDADGHPTNVKPLLDALVKDHPYLVKAAPKGGIPGTPQGDPAELSDDDRRKAAGNKLVRPRL